MERVITVVSNLFRNRGQTASPPNSTFTVVFFSSLNTKKNYIKA